MEFINKLRNQPKYIRKIILWSVMIFISIFLFILYIFNISNKIKNIKEDEIIDQLNLPYLEQEMQNLPKMDLPDEAKKEFEKLDNDMKEAGEEMEKLEPTQNFSTENIEEGE
ncbi:MAG: hypothetical protein ABH956_02710 [Candidatus Nealsonbacteria bacterium]